LGYGEVTLNNSPQKHVQRVKIILHSAERCSSLADYLLDMLTPHLVHEPVRSKLVRA